MKILLLMLALVCPLPAAPKPDEVVPYKKIEGGELKLHVFHPPGFKASDQRPAIVFFFGGGWNGGSPSQFYPQCEHLTAKGMVAISAEYRVKSRNKTTPLECVKDGVSAVRWVRAHAKEMGIDPKMIAAGGGSAGGHVAAATGTTKGVVEEGEDTTVSSRPDALVLFNPVFDNGPKGFGHARVQKYWKKISPRHNLDEKTPPTIVFLGTKDHLIPVATAEGYRDEMKKHGVRCDLHLYEGQTHGFFNKARYDETVAEMDVFLESLKYLKAEPVEMKPAEEPKLTQTDILHLTTPYNSGQVPRQRDRLYFVGKDGKIDFGETLGIVAVKGRSAMEVRAEIAKKYQEIAPGLADLVTVKKVVIPSGLKERKSAYIFGQVASPRVVLVDETTTITDVVKGAGKISPFAATNRIVVYRNSKVQTFNMKLTGDFKVLKGDVIFLPQKMVFGR